MRVSWRSNALKARFHGVNAGLTLMMGSRSGSAGQVAARYEIRADLTGGPHVRDGAPANTAPYLDPDGRQEHLRANPMDGAIAVKCLECGTESVEVSDLCTQCGAPIILRPSAALDPAGGPPRRRTGMFRVSGPSRIIPGAMP